MKTPTLYVFDLDDTLIQTTARIILRDKNTDEIIRYILTDEYNAEDDKSKFTENSYYFDFSEFNDYEILKNEKTTEIFNRFRECLENEKSACILTSREDPFMIMDWLNNVHGIPYEEQPPVICTSYKEYKHMGTDAEKKKKFLNIFCEKGGDIRFHVYEDSDNVMEEMGKLVEMNPKVEYIKDELRYKIYENKARIQQGHTEETQPASTAD